MNSFIHSLIHLQNIVSVGLCLAAILLPQFLNAGITGMKDHELCKNAHLVLLNFNLVLLISSFLRILTLINYHNCD